MDFSPVTREKPSLDASVVSLEVSNRIKFNDTLQRVGGSMVMIFNSSKHFMTFSFKKTLDVIASLHFIG